MKVADKITSYTDKNLLDQVIRTLSQKLVLVKSFLHVKLYKRYQLAAQ